MSLTRIQTGIDTLASGAMRAPDHNPARVYGTATKHVHNPEAVDHRGSILATRQRVKGIDTVRLDVNSEGSRTHISTAVRLGLLVESAPGYFSDAPKVAKVAPVVAPVVASAAPVPAAPPAPAAHRPSTPGRFQDLPNWNDTSTPTFGF